MHGTSLTMFLSSVGKKPLKYAHLKYSYTPPYKNNKRASHAACKLHVSSAHIMDAICEQNNACDKHTLCTYAMKTTIIMHSFCMYAFCE